MCNIRISSFNDSAYKLTSSIHMFPVLLLLLLVSISISEDDLPSTIQCDGLFYKGKFYDKHMLFESQGRPYNMFYDKYSGELLFSHTVSYGKQINFQIMTCNIKKRICKKVMGVPGGYAMGYDNINDEIYLGGDQGLYKHNLETNHATYFAERGKSVWSIFIRKHFYYIQHPSQQLYVYKKKKFIKVRETIGMEIDCFFVSRNLDVYFSNTSGLFKTNIRMRHKKPTLLTNRLEIRQIVEDLYGNVHFCASKGIYIEDKKKTIVRVAKINQVYSITFIDHFHLAPSNDRNQLIYSDQYAIYVLMTGNYSSTCAKAYKSSSIYDPLKIVKVVM